MQQDVVKGLTLLEEQETALIFGGVDKKLQDALYTIGYILGLIVRFIGTLFTFKKSREVVQEIL